jgi:PIN domain nuclease of toxin-antitoxin system
MALRLLLDTHLLVWFLIDRKRISERLMVTLVDPANAVYVSAVTVWELTIKVGIGKLSLPLDELEAAIAESGFGELSVTSAHALEVRHLPLIHRDPFDRLLVAQARHEGLTLVTRDTTMRRYPIDALWD